jgi:two-component system C4-dicarboxylate transport response regulator DctD
LYYRLNVAPLRIPPLRERGEDALVLFQHYADEASAASRPAAPRAAPGHRAVLLRHTWPGNVRELQNAAERFALGLELALDNSEPMAINRTVQVINGGSASRWKTSKSR